MSKAQSTGKNTVSRRALIALLMVFVLSGLGVRAMAAGPADKYKVDPSIVCMVTDNVMGKPQIPVKVGGKTYYGCCKNCVGKLNGNPAVRTAEDPVSGKMVDKSTAFIIEGSGGEALYFESALTAGKFIDSLSR